MSVPAAIRPSTEDLHAFVRSYAEIFLPEIPPYKDTIAPAQLERWASAPREHRAAIRGFVLPILDMVSRVCDFVTKPRSCLHLTTLDCEVFGAFLIIFNGLMEPTRAVVSSDTADDVALAAALTTVNEMTDMLRRCHKSLLSNMTDQDGMELEQIEAIGRMAPLMDDLFCVHEVCREVRDKREMFADSRRRAEVLRERMSNILAGFSEDGDEQDSSTAGPPPPNCGQQ